MSFHSLHNFTVQARRKQLQIGGGGGGAHINFWGAHIIFFLFFFLGGGGIFVQISGGGTAPPCPPSPPIPTALLPHNLIQDKLIALIEGTFQRECSLYLAYNDGNAFFTSEQPKNTMHGLVKMYGMRWHFCWTTFYTIWH